MRGYETTRNRNAYEAIEGWGNEEKIDDNGEIDPGRWNGPIIHEQKAAGVRKENENGKAKGNRSLNEQKENAWRLRDGKIKDA